MLLRLQSLAQGLWARSRRAARVKLPPGLAAAPGAAPPELWAVRLTARGGAVLFEVASDFSEASRSYKDMLRIWVRGSGGNLGGIWENLVGLVCGQTWKNLGGSG